MTTIYSRRLADGTYVEELPDGTTRPSVGESDWARVDAMTDEEIHAAALSDPDAQPLTEADLKRMKRLPQTRVIRRALHLTQEEFALRYHIPVGTLRDWEQGRFEPDQTAKAYLHVIAGDPEGISRLLQAGPRRTHS
ncbi:MAG TPA: helix-turn-helix domain-containing protein [Rhizomicrobium sp.]